MERWIMIAALAFIAGTAYEILKRLKMLQVVEARRALNFAHIEAEFSALRVMLGHLHNDEDFVERTDILKNQIMRYWLEGENNTRQLLMGVSVPEPEEDPSFHSADYITSIAGEPNPEGLLFSEQMRRDFEKGDQ